MNLIRYTCKSLKRGEASIASACMGVASQRLQKRTASVTGTIAQNNVAARELSISIHASE